MGSSSGNDSLASILRGSGFFILGKIVYNALQFLSNILLTQGLGPSLYGVYSLSWTIVNMVGSVSNLGADKAVLRYVSLGDDEQNSYLGISYGVATLGGGIAGCLLIVAAPIISSHTLNNQLFVSSLRLLSCFLIFNSFVNITSNSFRAVDRPGLGSLLKQVVKPFGIVSGIVIAFALSLPFLGYIGGIVLGLGATSIVGGVLLYWKTPLRPTILSHDVDLQEYLNYSIPLAISDAGSVLYTRSDILLVGMFLSASAVGYYQVAVLLTTLLSIPLAAVNQIFPPVVSRLYQSKELLKIERIYKTATRWVLTGTLPAATGLLVFRREILSLFGNEFVSATTILILFGIGQVTNGLVGPSGHLLMMTDHQFITTANQLSFGLLNILLNIYLINELGLIGAAVATAAVLAGINISRLVEVYLLLGIHPFSTGMAKPLMGALISTVSMIFIREVFPSLVGLVIGGTIGASLYIISLLIFGLDSDDKKLFGEWRE